MKIVLASYNILHGHHSDLIIKNIKFLIEKGANVICLQEADLLFKKSLNNLLKKELRDWKVKYFHTGIACNLAIAWNDRLLKLQDIRPVLLPTLSCDISYAVPQDGWGKAVKLCRLLHIRIRSLLDYMFIYNMKVVSAEMFDLAGSDHRPQLGEFEFN